MSWLDFQGFSIWLNALFFGLAAVVVWVAGSRVARLADRLAERTGLGQAFVGLLFLALVTEMPEIGTTVTAAFVNNAPLAVNNIFGGITMQTAILGVVDLLLIRGALTFFTPRPVLLLQGVMLVVLLALTLAGVAAGETWSIAGIGVWTILLSVLYVVSLYFSHRYEGQQRWEPVDEPGEAEARRNELQDRKDNARQHFKNWSTVRLSLFFAAGAGVILVAGVILARVAEALAAQTGLGASFVGATLLASATSLPEVSTTVTAVRLGNYDMAISNIFGSNGIMVALLFLSDVFYRGGPILNQVEPSSIFVVAVGIAVTGIYLIGMIERRDRTVLRMGFDSASVLVLYILSLIVVFRAG